MKVEFLLTSLVALMGCISTAEAAPQQYAFYASKVDEFDGNGYAVNPADYLFSTSATVFGSFTYTTNVPPLFTDVPATGDLAGYGHISYYFGSLSDFVGNVGSYTFSAASGSTLVANSNAGDGVNDGVFNLFGTVGGNVQGSGFNGFSIGGFNLLSVNIYSVAGVDYLTSQALPAHLSTSSSINGIRLTFENDDHNQRTAVFVGPQLSSVPVPAAAWLFGSGLIGLLGVNARRRAK